MYFLKHTEIYFVINDFSDIVFFMKRFIPHMEVFFRALLTLDTLAMNGYLVQISSGAAHSDLVSKIISLDPDKV